MRRYWWTVWIKVAILAVAVFVAFNAAKKIVVNLLDPYVLGEISQDAAEETTAPEDGEEGKTDLVQTLVGKVENTLGVRLDYENLIFDYANEYAQNMMEQSDEERSQINEPLS